jgi:hypothetical protein
LGKGLFSFPLHNPGRIFKQSEISRFFLSLDLVWMSKSVLSSICLFICKTKLKTLTKWTVSGPEDGIAITTSGTPRAFPQVEKQARIWFRPGQVTKRSVKFQIVWMILWQIPVVKSSQRQLCHPTLRICGYGWHHISVISLHEAVDLYWHRLNTLGTFAGDTFCNSKSLSNSACKSVSAKGKSTSVVLNKW